MQIQKITDKLLSSSRDDYQFLDACRRHGILALVHRAQGKDPSLASKLSPAVKEGAERSYYAIAMSNLRRREELAALLDAFKSAGIDAIVLKGMALTAIYYRDEGLRPMGDIDLFVKKDDAAKISTVLSRLDYEPFDAQRQPLLKELSSGLQFGREGEFLLETSWDLVSLDRMKNIIRVDNDDLWRFSREYDGGPAPIRAFVAELQILTLGLHYFLHGFSRLIWLVDIAQVIHQLGEEIDWDLVCAKARQYKIKTLTWLTLKMAGQILDAPVPEKVTETLCPGAAKRKIIENLVGEREMVSTPRGRDEAKRYLTELALMDGIGPEARFSSNIFFPSRAWIVNHYNLADDKGVWHRRIAHPFILIKDAFRRN
jgi:hypothetical protein